MVVLSQSLVLSEFNPDEKWQRGGASLVTEALRTAKLIGRDVAGRTCGKRKSGEVAIPCSSMYIL